MDGLRGQNWRTLVAPVLAGLAAATVLAVRPAGPLAAQGGPPALVPSVGHAEGFAASPRVSDLPEEAATGPVAIAPLRELPRAAGSPPRVSTPDGAIQSFASSLVPIPTLGFDGLSSQDNFNTYFIRAAPPDPNGDVGPNHYVQAVNLLVRVYSKTGVPLTAPFKMSSLFGSLGGICSTNNNGDPIVLYDPLADRWLISQFAFSTPTTPPYHQCIAISQTPDPTGGYFLYDFISPGNNLNDYPKFGVWADAYYMTDNQFVTGGPFNGAGVFAFDRAKMLAGDNTASFVYFGLSAAFGGMLPADLDGSTPPPAGAPGYFAMLQADEFGDPDDAMRLFALHADFVNPAASTFTELPESPLGVAPFDPLNPAGRNDIEQPSPATSVNYLDSIQDRLMHRLAYRNFGNTRESLVVAHTVNVGFDAFTAAGHQAAVRYYELRRSLPGGAFTVAEQATFAPDTDNRWMGSAAMDRQGNIAVGYSASSLTTFPSVRYAGRLFSDPPNGLFQGEGALAVGSGVQLITGGRWGDYSALSVDPSDDCTFWYTNEYYTAASQATSTAGWLTRIGTFKFPNCGPQAPQGTVAGRVTDAATGAPIAGAVVSLSPGVTGAVADTGGSWAATLPPGTYSLTVSVRNRPYQSVFGVVVANGSTTTVNFALTLPPDAGIVMGHVRNATTSAPISGAVVNAGSVSSTTDAAGLYVLNLPVGTYTVTASAAYYLSLPTSSVTVSNQGVATRDFALSLPANTGFLTGHVRDAANVLLANATVSAGGLSTATNAAGVYTLLLPVGSYTVTASATDYVDGSASAVVAGGVTTTSDLTLQRVVFTQAVYDATLRAPRCGQPGASCDTGALVISRDTLAGGVEPNQPNTILNSCPDGSSGTFHADASLDRIEVYTLDGGVFASGKTVRIQATVWANAPTDRLDLYYTTNASSPDWTLLTTLVPPGPGTQKLVATYVLPAGPLQAVRGNYRTGGTASPCAAGSSDDRDDLIFAPTTVTGQVTDVLTGAPIAGALINVGPGGHSATTNVNGVYAASVPAGTYTLTASAPTHLSQSVSGVSVTNGSTATVNFALSLAATAGILTGHVRSAATNAPIANAVVSGAGASSTTDAAGLYALFLAPGTHTVTIVAADYITASEPGIVVVAQAVTARELMVQPIVVVQAAYNPSLKAPMCGTPGGVCDSGSQLVGRDTIFNGAEPNQPNTILNSCADGASGTFHVSESLDRIKVATLDGTPLAPGKTARIDATVWVSSVFYDRLELYQTANANSPSWALIATLFPSITGVETLSTTYVLPQGGLQAVRGRFWFTSGSSLLTSCPSSIGFSDDHDDLIFNTDTTLAAPAFFAQPSNRTVQTGSAATFAAGVSGYPAPSYQWQMSTDGGTSWTSLVDSASYSGVMTATLTVSGVPFSINGSRFRVVATNSAGSATSNAATLTVADALVVTTLAGLAGNAGSTDGTGAAAGFTIPHGVAVDSTGTVYVADTSNNTIRKITPAGVVTTLAGLAGNSGSTDGTGSAARFASPGGVAVDAAGMVYVADTFNHTVRKITQAGVVTTLAGLAGSSGSTDGTGTAARFSYPHGVAADAAGTVYVADSNNFTIRKITPAGVVTTLAGFAANSGSADGTGAGARFSYMLGVTVDGAGTVYVADSNNFTIRKITPAGVVTTLAGLAGNSGSADGTGGNARFAYPYGVAVGATGTVYVADTSNQTIRQMMSAGLVLTLAGLAGSSGNADGVGAAARFAYPYGVAVDTAGTIYVADTSNNTIRKGTLASSSGLVFTALGALVMPVPAESTQSVFAGHSETPPSAAPQPETGSVTAGTTTATVITNSGPLTAIASGLAASVATPLRDRAAEAVAAAAAAADPDKTAPALWGRGPVSEIQTVPQSRTVGPVAPSRSAQVFSAVATVSRLWEVEVFGGGLLASRPGGGAAAFPGAGEAFATSQGNPSRRVSSWYFGDGALLLNQVNAALGVSQQFTPLDGFLGSAVVHRQNGRSLGVRVSRALSPRLTLEATAQFGPGVAISRGNLDRLESTRATYLSAWNGLFATGPFQNLSLTSTMTPTGTESGHQLLTTGALNIALRRGGTMIPYVTVGAGLASSTGGTPTTTVVGAYRFVFNGTTPINELDTVTIRHAAGNTLVGVLGGGVKYFYSPRWGVRLDARWYLSPGAIDNLVDTSFAVASGSPAGSVASATNPAIQFSNSPSTGIQSSLSGPALTDFRTFEGGGIQNQLSVTAGIIRRF